MVYYVLCTLMKCNNKSVLTLDLCDKLLRHSLAAPVIYYNNIKMINIKAGKKTNWIKFLQLYVIIANF